MKRIIWTIVITLVVVLLIPIIVLATGMLSMAASQKPGVLEKTFANFAMERSVAVRASDEANPFQDDQEAVSTGLTHYAAMCVRCHGGPGVEPEEFAKGLNPPAPDMKHAVEEFSTGELFWIVKHGVRMTGMPAFGVTHKDEDLWKIVAFLQQLPDLSDEHKQTLKKSVGEQGHGHDHHAENGHQH